MPAFTRFDQSHYVLQGPAVVQEDANNETPGQSTYPRHTLSIRIDTTRAHSVDPIEQSITRSLIKVYRDCLPLIQQFSDISIANLMGLFKF